MICGTHDVTGSRHEDMFTYVSPVAEKLEKQDKFQPKDKSYLYNILKSDSETELLKDGSTASVANPKAAAFFAILAKFVTANIHVSFGNSSELFFLAQICFLCLVLFSVSACFIFVASTERKISLLPSMAIHISMTTCDACVVDHELRFTRSSPSIFAYCKRSKTGAGEGLGTRLEDLYSLAQDWTW